MDRRRSDALIGRNLAAVLGIVAYLLAARAARCEERHAGLSTEEWLLVASMTGDLVSTEMVLAQPGGVEYNPIGQERAARIALKAGAAIFVIWGARELREDGHPRMAAILTRSTIAANFFATGWNVAWTVRLNE